MNKFSKYLPILSLVVISAACVKERGNNFANQSAPSSNTVDFPNQIESKVFEISTTPTTFSFYVELNGSKGSYPDATVTIAKSTSTVTAAGYSFLPDSSYQLLNTTATVDPTTHLAKFDVKVFTNKVDLAGSFAIGYTIASVTNGITIASNKNSTYIIIGVKNKYDGIYIGKGYALRAGDATLTGYFQNVEFGLVTFGANACDFNRLQVWGDGVSGIGIGIPRVSIDPATNAVTMSSPGGATNYPGYPNRYDPATKTFYIGITWGAGPASRAAFDTLVYSRPR